MIISITGTLIIIHVPAVALDFDNVGVGMRPAPGMSM